MAEDICQETVKHKVNLANEIIEEGKNSEKREWMQDETTEFSVDDVNCDDNSDDDEEGGDGEDYNDINTKIATLYDEIIAPEEELSGDMANCSVQECESSSDGDDDDVCVQTDPDGNPISWLKKKIKGKKSKKRIFEDKDKSGFENFQVTQKGLDVNVNYKTYPVFPAYPQDSHYQQKQQDTKGHYYMYTQPYPKETHIPSANQNRKPDQLTTPNLRGTPIPRQNIQTLTSVNIIHENDQYDFNHKTRGTALIFSFNEFRKETKMKPRKGAEKEAVNLAILLKCLGFNVVCHINKTKWEMETELKLAARANHSDADCFICIISSHGSNDPSFPQPNVQQTNDIIYATDGFLLIDDILKTFRDDNCPSLVGKPKLFFVQACRGSKYSQKVDVTSDYPSDMPDHPPLLSEDTLLDNDPEETPASLTEHEEMTSHQQDGLGMGKIWPWMPMAYTCLQHPCYKDFLLAYSTLPGYFSFRKQGQSWFLYHLWEELKSTCYDLELTEIMEKVNYQISYNCSANMLNAASPALRALHGAGQMPWVMSMLTKDVYLKPKDPRRRYTLQKLWWQ